MGLQWVPVGPVGASGQGQGQGKGPVGATVGGASRSGTREVWVSKVSAHSNLVSPAALVNLTDDHSSSS